MLLYKKEAGQFCAIMDQRQTTQNKWSKELKISLHPIRRPACDKYARNNINHNVDHTPLKYFINKSAGVR